MASTRSIVSASSPIMIMSDGTPTSIGPFTTEAAAAGKITGIARFTDVNDRPFEIPLTEIAGGAKAVADPSLKGMTALATNGETIIGQALPDGSPNAQYPAAALRANLDTISFANADKQSTTMKLTGGLYTAAGVDFSTGNAARDAIGVPQLQLHGCMHWHKGHPSAWAPTAANIKSQLDIMNAAYKKNWDDRGYTAALKYIDSVNEVVDNAKADYVCSGKITDAFRASSDWRTEMEALGVPEITKDPGAFGFLYSLKKAAETWGAGVQIAYADFGYAENTTAYGYGQNADNWATFSHQAQRWERGLYNIRQAMRAFSKGYPGRIDNLNVQSHLSPGRIVVPADLRWRNYEANMLGMGVMMGEINLLLSNAESAAAFAAVGITPGTPEEFLWNVNYVATYLVHMRVSCTKLKLIQPWTDATDFGDGALTTFDKVGQFDVVGRAIQKAMMQPIVKNAIRAGRTLFGKANGFKPYELEGTITGGGPTGIRGTGLKMPMSRYLRRDVADGLIKEMSTTKWDQTFFMLRSGANAAVAGGRAWYFEDAAGNVVLSFTFNAAGNLTMTTAAGTLELGFTSNGDYLRIGVSYRDGVLKACYSRRTSSSPNTITPASAVITQNVNLPALAKFGMMDATSTSNAIEHRIYDETHLSANDAELFARTTLTPELGSAIRAAAIFDGSAMIAAAA